MKVPAVEEFARSVMPERVASIRAAASIKSEGRKGALVVAFDDPEAARSEAARIKDFVLDNLRELLVQLEQRCEANGIKVHWAPDAGRAKEIILGICAAQPGCTIAKAKSMATEEIHLNEALEEAGFHPVETDLGEYIVQIDHDTPSHIVMPIIHKNRVEVAQSFAREGLGPYTEEAGELTMQARARLRSKFKEAKVGISGVNFAVAETGRIVLIENEGNNRLCTTAPDVHIAVMGIEKILPSEADLALFIKLLTASATGQHLPVYTHFLSGPRRSDEQDGPGEVHLVLLDNGRTRVLNGPYREILRCIRCGACLNVCPVYRQSSGHAYGHVYSGPLGAVLAPAMDGVEARGDLAKASSLCGACEEVCPVKIPMPSMLLRLRDEAERSDAAEQPIPWNLYAEGATSSFKWRTGLKLLPMASSLPHPLKNLWTEFRALPKPNGTDFRAWWAKR